MADTPWLQTDHDIIVDLRPRVANLERERDRADRRMDGHDTILQTLQATIAQVEERLRTEVHAAVDPIEEHLTRQDEAYARATDATAQLREEVAGARAAWPQGATAFVAAAATFAAVTLAAILAHVRF